MNRLTVRQLQRLTVKELEERLPFEVTNDGEVFMVCATPLELMTRRGWPELMVDSQAIASDGHDSYVNVADIRKALCQAFDSGTKAKLTDEEVRVLARDIKKGGGPLAVLPFGKKAQAQGKLRG